MARRGAVLVLVGGTALRGSLVAALREGRPLRCGRDACRCRGHARDGVDGTARGGLEAREVGADRVGAAEVAAVDGLGPHGAKSLDLVSVIVHVAWFLSRGRPPAVSVSAFPAAWVSLGRRRAAHGVDRPEPSRPAYAGDDRGAKTEAAAEERGGSREEKREEKRRGRFGKAEGKKDAKPAEGRDPSTAPRRAAPKPAPAGPSKGTRALTVVAAAAIAVSVGATVFSGMRVAESSAIIAKNEANSVNVVVTNRDVAAGETITEADLETQAVPKAYCPTDAATKVSDVAGHTSLTTQTAGTSISLSSLQASSSPAHITSAIEDGHVAIALSLDSSKSLSPLLRVGDRVNVMAVVSDGATSSAETVCANVKIIALDSALSGSPDAGYSLVTLDVTEDQAAAIVANPNVTLTAIPQTAEGASDAE